MQIFVSGAKTDLYNVSPSITVSDLKELIEIRSGVSYDNQVLTYAGRPLADEHTLAEGDLKECATVNLCERLLGGKVHGSLARAGKVKGQTPKVDPQVFTPNSCHSRTYCYHHWDYSIMIMISNLKVNFFHVRDTFVLFHGIFWVK